MKLQSSPLSAMRRAFYLLILAIGAGVSGGALAAPVGCATPGKDGAVTVTAGTIVNSYYPGSGTSTSTTVTLGSKRSGSAAENVAAGDLVLVMQMQDGSATDFTTAATYGTNAATSTAGLYEYATVQSVVGSVVTLDAPLTNTYTQNYSSRQIFQVIRVPQYSNLTVSGAISPLPWTIDASGNGTGGVLVFDVAGALALNGNLNAKGLGFRGGGALNVATNRAGGVFNDQRYPSSTNNGASKGEGTAGTPANAFNGTATYSTYTSNYTNGENGQGAPGNAGGGGNDGSPTNQSNGYNSGGGGGSNAGAGGVGGNSWFGGPLGPDAGGRGARAAGPSTTRLFLGGGGGAGTSNNNAVANAVTTYPPNATGGGADGPVSSSGANGGGIILVRSQTISGSGQFDASGNRAYNTSGGSEAAGAGGAGGSVALTVSSGTASPTINVSGGRGGDSNYYRHGPGGGGGGGFVITSSNLTPSNSIAGGAQGVDSTAGAPANYTPVTYGSAAGVGGAIITAVPPTVTACFPVLAVSKTTTTANRVQGGDTIATYSITVTNTGGSASGVSLSDALPIPFTYTPAAITPVYAGGASGPASVTGSGSSTVVFGAAGGTTANSFSIPFNGSVTLTFNVNLNAAAAGTYQNPATVSFTDPTRTATQTVSPGDAYTNAGTVGGSNYASGSTPNEDVTIAPRIDLSLTKTSSPPNPPVGSNVTFTVTVSNAANFSNATGVGVTDLLPSGYTFFSSSPSQGTYLPATGVWTVGTVNAGSSANLQIVAKVLGSGAYGNTAQVSAAGQTDIDSIPNNSVATEDDQATNTPVPAPRIDLSVAKTFLPAATVVGGSVTFTVTVANATGLSNASGVSVKDLLPSGYAYFSSSPSQGTYVPATGIWTVGAINAGSSANIQITATILGSGVYANTAEVSAATETDINSIPNNNIAGENDQATATPAPAPRINLSLTKTSSPANPPVGSNVTFTVTVPNAAGLSNATGVTVLDQLPAGYTYVSDNSAGAYNSASGVWTVGTINAGSSASIQIVAKVLPAGPYANTAQVSAAGQTDINSTPNNNVVGEDDQATNTPTPVASIDLSTTKSFLPAAPLVGSNVTFTVTVANAPGFSSATGVAVKDQLPAGYTYVSDNSAGAYNSVSGIWTVGTVNSGSSAAIQITAKVLPAGPYANTAEVSAAVQTDINSIPNNGIASENDQATVTPVPAPRIDLSTVKTVSSATPAVGSNVTFTVTVSNATGFSSATGVAVKDQLPAGYSFVSDNAAGAYVPATGIWTVGTINSGSSAAIQIVAKVLAAGPYANTAEVSAAGQTDIDSIPNNGIAGEDDQATITPAPVDSIDLSTTKTSSPLSPAVGSNVTFTVTVANAAGLSTATGVAVKDQLPSGYTYVSDNAAGAYVPATGIWTVGAINSGSSASIQIVAKVLATGVYANTAEVNTAVETDINSTPNNGIAGENDQATNTPTPSPRIDLSTTKTSSLSNPVVGTNVTFTVTVANAIGFSSATGVAVKDQLPAGYTYVSDNSAGAYVPATGIWTVGTINAGSSASIQIVAKVLAAGPYANTAEVSAAGQTDINSTPNNGIATENDQATNTPTPVASIDLSTTKSFLPAAPLVGSNVTFTITVANAAGLSSATGVAVKDQLPAGYSYVSDNSSGAYVPATGIWTVGTINSGSSASIQIVAKVLATGPYANTAEVSAAVQTDVDSAPNNGVAGEDDQATVTPAPAPRIDLSLTKTSSPANPPVGSNVTFTVAVANAAGLSNATGVTVLDQLPAGYSYVSDNAAGAYVPATGIWTIGNINSGSSASLQIVATVNPTGAYANTAQVNAAVQTDIDSLPGNGVATEDDQATDTPTPAPRINLSMTKTATPAAPSVGSNVTFTLTVLNAANLNTATGVVVKDSLPNGYTYLSDNGAGAYVPATGIWTVGTVASGSSKSLQIVATVLATGVYTNSTEVTAAGQTDTNSTPNDGAGDDFATVTPGATPIADLSLTKTSSPANPAVASNVTFTITVPNAGPSTATGVVVKDQLPSGYTYVSHIASQGAYVPATGIWTIGNINSASSVNLQVVATVKATGIYGNTAEVTVANETDPDSAPNNNNPLEDDQATNTPTPSPRIDLSTVKTSSPLNPAVGGNVTFTVTVANAANLSTATGVAVKDQLPSGYSYVSDNAAGAYVPATGIWTVGTVGSGSSATIQIVAKVLATGVYANTAEVSAAGQTDINSTPNNGVVGENDQATNTPTPAPRVDLSLAKTVAPTSPAVGANATFTVTVSNATNLSNATGVAVKDQLPAGYAYVSDNSAGAYVPATGIWTVGTVGSGSSASIQIVAKVLATGPYANTAEVSAAVETDINSTPNNNIATENDQASATPTPVASIDLSATKTSSPINPAVGSNVTFTVTVANAAGLSSATGVAVKDQLPSGYAYVSDNAAGAYVPATGIWTVGTVGSGSSASIQIVVKVLATGAYANTAEVSAAVQTDINSTPNNGIAGENDQATNTPTPSPRIDLSTTKTSSPTNPVVGTNVTFTVTVANATGLSSATGVTVKDQLPAGYTYISDNGAGAYNSGTGIWTVGTVGSGSSASLQIVGKVLAAGPYANTAEVNAAGQTDINSSPNNGVAGENDQATNTPTPVASIDLSTVKTVSSATPAVGTNVTFTVTVANAIGLSSATGVAVKDQLPAGYSYVSDDSAGAYVPATGIWTVGAINSGSSAAIQIVAKVNAAGPYTNTAEVSAAGQTDVDSTPNNRVATEDDQASIAPVPSPRVDLSLLKTSSPVSPPVGSNVIFTVTVANAAGLSNATGVSVKDQLPSGYSFVSATPSVGTYAPVTGLWTLGAVNAGSSANLQITATVLGSGVYANTAEVSAANETDINSTPDNGVATENDQATDTPTPSPRVNLSMTKTASPASPTVGSNVTFTLTVLNQAGLSDATGVIVKDSLPTGYTYVSDNGAGAYVAATGIWTVGGVNAGSSKSLQIVATVKPTGVYTNSTEVTVANQPDTNSTPNDGAGDDFATVTPGAVPIADLSLTKTSSPANPAVGSNVTFTITVPNAGPSTATGVEVTDSLPSGYSFVSATPSQGTYAAGTGIWTIGNINPLSSVTLQVVATVKATGPYANTAQVTKSVETDPDSAPNNNAPLEDDQATDTPTPSPRIDLSVTKTSSPVTPAVGSNVTFTVTLANAANLSIASGVTLTDQLPSGYSYVSHVASVGTYVPATGLWTVGAVNSGSSVTLTIIATVRPNGIYANTAQVTAAGETDINSTPNNNIGSENDQATNTPVPSPRIDLSLTKLSNPANPAVGGTVTFTLTVSNAGPSIATGVSVLDNLPAGYSFTTSSASQGSYASGTGIWTVGALNANGSATLTVNATVLANGPYANTAQVQTANETDLDSTPGNSLAGEDDQATDTPTPSPRADLRVNKAVTPASPAIGANATFTVTVSNNGPSAATGVVLTDQLPSGYTFASATPSQGTYVAGTGIWTVGSIANAGNATLTIIATVRSSGDYTNTAEVTVSGVIDPTSVPNDGTGDDRDSVGITPAGFSTLSGRVYADVNLNGADNGEPGIGGVSLTLTGTDISGNPVFSNATTDATGAFSFAGLPPSDATGYTILQTQPANYTSGATTNGAPAGVTGINTISDIVVPANTIGAGYAFGEQRADISVAKTASSAAPAVGSTVTFTVVASNAGPTNASGVTISDPLPTGYTYISDSGAGAYVPATGAWTVGSLAASGNATLTITARVGPSGNYANTAQLTGSNQADPDSAPNNNNPAEDDQSTASLTPVATIDLSLTKTSSPLAPAVGSNLTFLITVANAANLSTATGVQITDLLPSGYTFVSATPSSGTYNAATGSWTLGTLNAGSSATLSVVAQVRASGNYSNTAQVAAADQPDADSAPNNNNPLEDDQATDAPAPSPRADLDLSKTVSNTAPNIGSNVAFLVTLSNAGPSPATGVIVKDALPSGYSFVSATPSGTTTYSSGVWTVGTVANGASATLTVIATVNPSGNYTNVAEITASNEIDPDSTPNDGAGDDYATKGVTPAGLSNLGGRVYADVNLSGTDNSEPGVGGVTVTLTGTDANGASVNLSTTTDATGAYSFAGLLPPQTATTYTLTQTQPANYSGTISNVGTGAGGVAGSNQITGIGFPSGTAATGYSFAEARADISVTKSASTTNPNVGTSVTFTVNVSNAGPTDATGIVVADALPSGFTLVGTPTATAGTYVNGVWTVGALGSGATQTLTITASVNPSGNYTNIAQLTGSDQADPNSAPNNNNPSENDQAAAPLTPTPVADIAVSKTGPAKVAGGASVSYTVTVVNNGPSSANGVVVTDTLPSALSGVTVSSGGVVTASTATWTLPTLAVGAPVSFTVTGTAPVTGTLVNLVSGSSSTLDTTPNNNDSNPANDPVGSPSSVTTQVVSAPSVTKSFSPNPIPAGGTSTLTVTLTNPNTSALTGSSLTDPLPSGLTPVAGTAATTCAGGTASQTASSLTLTGGTIPASGSCTLTLQLRPSSSASGKGAQVNTIPAGALTSNESPASPAPATATLDIASVGAAKSATVPVNNNDGTYSVTYTVTLENLGSVALNSVQALENLSATFPSPATFTIQTAPVAGAGLSVNPAFNGSSNTNLLVPATSSLAVGASRTVVFTVRVTPGATPPATTFSNSVIASATGPGPTPVSDISNAGTDPDPNGNGNPGDPLSENASTPVNFSENPVIGVAKQAAAPFSNGNGTYTVPFTVVVRNYGDVPLVNIAAIENLTTTFGTALVSSSVPTLKAGSAATVTPNAGFTGTGANTDLVGAGSSLAVGASATLEFSVVIRPTPAAFGFSNNVTAQGNSPAGTPVADNSTNGTDPNPTPATPPTDDTAITPVNFGVITGQAFTDTNGDGTQQAGEPNLTNTTVTITPVGGGTPFTVTTNGAGVYSAVVPAGSTTANVTDPSGTILTTANDPQTKVVAAGATTTNAPVGFQATAGLVGRVFTDTNGNGRQDAGEAGISGATVTVTPGGGGAPVTATTNSSGDYIVAGLAAGQYSANVSDPSGTVLTTANDPQTVTVAANGAGSATSVGFQPTGTVVGRVFRDDNGNGSQGSAEIGLAGVQVKVTNGGYSNIVTTDSSGDYTLSGVPIGTATVDIVNSTLPAGVTQTAGTDPSVVTVLAGVSNNAGADGYRLPAPVATNNSATTAQGTPVTFPIAADDSATSPLTITISSVDLDPSTPIEDKTRSVPEGTYSANPDGTVTFTPNAGATGSVTPIQYTVKDSSGNVSNAATLEVIIGAATLGGVTGDVFNDLNANGLKDAGEGLAGVQVTVTSGATVQTVTTNATGTYTALGLPVGAAIVDIVNSSLPAGLTQTVGTDPSTVTVVAGATANAGLDGYRAAPPVAVGDNANTPFNTAVTFPITGNDTASSGGAIDPATVTFPILGQPSGSSVSPDFKTLTTPSGVYTVDGLGNLTFTPATGFTGTAPSVNYTVKDSAGQPSNAAPISLTVGSSTTGVVRGIVYRDDNGNGVQDGSEPGLSGVSVVITPASGPAVTVVTDSNGNYSAANIALGNAGVDITDSSLPAGARATVAGADPTTVSVVAGNNNAGSDGYRLAPPVAANDSASTPVNTPITFSVTGNDSASDPYNIVPSSVDLDPLAPGVQTTRSVPEGVYTVNGVGEINFAPKTGFSGNVTPIQYTVKDSTGQTSSPATVSVTVTPTASNDVATTGLNAPVTISVLSNDLGSLLPNSVAFPIAGQPSGSSVSPDFKTLTVPGVGVYTANPTGTVTFAPANGFSGTAPSVLYSVSDGVTTRTASIAVTVTSQTVSGKVFSDSNGNGAQDAIEPGISGATVTVTDGLGSTRTVTTDVNGNYTADVPVGSTTITITTPTGTTLTTANNPQTVNVPAGGATAAPVGFQPRATITGVIFTDTNGDGVQQAGEPGISGATVTVTPVGGGAAVTVTTDANGNYSAPNLPLGDYTVSTATPANSALTTGNNPQTVTLPAGGAVSSPIGFKPVTSGGITGKVFNDANGNGALEANESGLSGATVALYEVKPDGTPDLTKPLKNAGGKPITAITDASGNYSFSSIPTGPVAILVTDPSGKVLTTANNPQVVTVPSGASVTAAAVGYVQPKIDLTLTPDVTVVTPGDNLPYTAVITNNTPGTITPLNNPVLNVTLPKGVLYDPTKPVTVGGVVIPAGSISVKVDPTDPSRQILTVKLPTSLVNNTPQTVKFSTIVTPAVNANKPLIAVGQVTATAGAGVTAVSVSSNAVAAAAVTVNLGVFSTDTIILGRVYFDKNDNNNFDAGDLPLPGARIYLSDGRYAVTDGEGRYNITGVKPGTYAVRLDPVTAPYAPKRVPDDAGAPGTRFVNANQGGGISNEDFPLETPLVAAVKSRSTVVQRGPVTLEKAITQGGAGYAVTYTITVTKAVSNLAITDPLPAGAERGPVTGATLEGNVLRFAGITQPGTYTVTFALFSAAPPDLILTDPEILYTEIFTLIPSSPPNSSSGSDPSSPNNPASSGGSTNSQEVKR